MIITKFYPSNSYCSFRQQMPIVVPHFFLQAIILFFVLGVFFVIIIVNVHYH